MGAAKSSKELDALKEQAKELGISYSPNIGLEALQKKVQLALGNSYAKQAEPQPEEKINKEVVQTLSGMKNATKLHRVVINCLNPDKLDLKTEILSVGNTKYGFITRAFRFGVPWHVEDFLYKHLKNKKFFNTRDEIKYINGVKRNRRVTELVPEYEVRDLPPLTQEELKKLALDQSASGRLRDDLAE